MFGQVWGFLGLLPYQNTIASFMMRQTLSAVVEAVRHTITTTPRQQADQHYWLRHQSDISPSGVFIMETSSPVFGNFAILVL